MLNNLLLHIKSLSLPDLLHVLSGNVFAVGFFAEVFEFFLGVGDPEGVEVEGFEAGKDELRVCGTRGAFAEVCEKVGGVRRRLFVRLNATTISPSAKPKLSTTGIKQDTLKNGVPS